MIDRDSHDRCGVELRLVLSASDVFKAAKIGGMPLDEQTLCELWHRLDYDPLLRLELHEAAIYALHGLLTDIAFDAVFTNPSPFIIDDSF